MNFPRATEVARRGGQKPHTASGHKAELPSKILGRDHLVDTQMVRLFPDFVLMSVLPLARDGGLTGRGRGRNEGHSRPGLTRGARHSSTDTLRTAAGPPTSPPQGNCK